MTLRGTLSAACGLLFAAVLCSAQSTNASIYGTITDSSGAVISKSNVIAVNSRTGVSLSTVSNDSGVYIFPSLQPGEYSVSAESAGFRKAVAQKIQLDVSARITVDLKLEIGATAESVTVESTAGPLETVNTSVSNVVSLQRVQDLPLQNRDAGSLVALQAGVVGDNFNGGPLPIPERDARGRERSGDTVQRRPGKSHDDQQRRPGGGVSRQHGARRRRVRSAAWHRCR